MRIERAVLTAAGPGQRQLATQTITDGSGSRKSVLRMLLEESLAAGIQNVAVVMCPDDRESYLRAAGDLRSCVTPIEQGEPLGYSDALCRAQEWTDNMPFLHLVGDHVWLSTGATPCAKQLVDVATAERCTVSAVQATHESRLREFGAVGGAPLKSRLYVVEEVLEKPTPTEAEQKLHVSGLRAGRYLCFFGMHVLTPGIWPCLARGPAGERPHLSEALATLARQERYLAFEPDGQRYDLGARHGFLIAELALALSGNDRDEVLEQLVQLLALRSGKPR